MIYIVSDGSSEINKKRKFFKRGIFPDRHSAAREKIVNEVLKMPGDVRLFVYGVNKNCPREVLEYEFGQCGDVTDVYNNGKGYAFVQMASLECVLI